MIAPAAPRPIVADEGAFHCSWEWHFQNFHSRLAPLIHSWGCRLSHKSDRFFPSHESIARHFGCKRITAWRALQELVRTGWAEVIRREPGKPVAYRFIEHEEWARNHPNRCAVKLTMPWDGDGDPLARELWAVSGGRIKFFKNQITGFRKSGLPDEQIIAEFRAFVDKNPPQNGQGWKDAGFRFHTHLRFRADVLKAAAGANFRSVVLHA